jgi:hypothetical protein
MKVVVRLRRFAGEHLPAVPRAQLRAARRGRAKAESRARANIAAYEKLVAAIEARAARPDSDIPAPGAAARVRATIRVLQAHAKFAEMLSTGASLEAAATATVRGLVEAGRPSVAASFADALAARPETANAGGLAVAIVAAHRKLPGLAWDEFTDVPTRAWRQFAATEYLDSGFRQDPTTAMQVARDLVADRAIELGPAEWYEVLRHAYVARDLPLAREAFDLLVERAQQDPAAWPDAEAKIAWLRPWLDSEVSSDVPPPPRGTVAFALINYRQPGWTRTETSYNIGDYVQTLAALGHLVRYQNLDVRGPADLVEFAREMQRRVRPERRLHAYPGDVQLYAVNRDVSTYQAFPEPTWMLAFGWYMHPLFKLRHDFPMHPNLRPIFVSFHCNKREMLTEPAIDHLRRYGPIGCRDWTTVDLLLSLDIPAFFSGCLTTTVDTLFPALDPESQPPEPRTVYVDVRDNVPEGAATATQDSPEVKQRDFEANLWEAVALLERYRRTYTRVVTAKLHCYLPVRSLGLEVDFRPKNRADVRFNGLIDIDDVDFDSIRSGMLDRLEPVLGAIVGGTSEDEVYRLWRELCADDVKAAQVRHSAIGPALVPPFDVAATRSRILAAATTAEGSVPRGAGPVVDVAIIVGPGDRDRLPVLVDSILAGTSRPVHLWLLTRSYGANERRELTGMFPELSISWMPCDDVIYGNNNGGAGDPGGRDLLLLPELADVMRIVVVPPTAVVVGDVAELAEYDIGGQPLAARTSVGVGSTSGFGVFYRAARRLDPRADLAHDLHRRVHGRHVFDFDAFDTDVLVLDLDAMRRDRFSAEFLPYAGEFGFTARELLTYYAGPNRAVIPPQWAHIPSRERVADPQLIYWVDSNVPWRPAYVRHRETWTRAAKRAARRARRDVSGAHGLA